MPGSVGEERKEDGGGGRQKGGKLKRVREREGIGERREGAFVYDEEGNV